MLEEVVEVLLCWRVVDVDDDDVAGWADDDVDGWADDEEEVKTWLELIAFFVEDDVETLLELVTFFVEEEVLVDLPQALPRLSRTVVVGS